MIKVISVYTNHRKQDKKNRELGFRAKSGNFGIKVIVGTLFQYHLIAATERLPVEWSFLPDRLAEFGYLLA